MTDKERIHEVSRREWARRRLIPFARYIDPEVGPMYNAPHLRFIASQLERVERGEVTRLCISVPPRHWKSSLSSIKFPLWYLSHHPRQAVIIASATITLADKFTTSIRDTINANSRYKELFPKLRVSPQASRSEDWMLTGGHLTSCRAIGVMGSIIGHGAHLMVLDDVIDPQQVQSEVERENMWSWYRDQIRLRLEPGGKIIVVNTRSHELDLIGHLEEFEKVEGGEHFEIINLPAYDRQADTFIWEDRFGKQYYYDTMSALGGENSYGWRTQFMGTPTSPEGSLIRADWFDYFPSLPSTANWKVRAWDCAFTEKQTEKHDPDYTATCVACVDGDALWLGRPRLFRANIENLTSAVIALRVQEPAIRYGGGKSWIESSIAKSLVRNGYSFEKYDEDKDKKSRSAAWVNKASLRMVKLVGTKEEWLPFMNQFTAFPLGGHDDAIDAVSGCAQLLGLKMMNDAKPKPRFPLYLFAER